MSTSAATIGIASFALGLNLREAFELFAARKHPVLTVECKPEFCLGALKVGASKRDLDAIGRPYFYTTDKIEEWLVVCRCNRYESCPWIEATNDFRFALSAAVDRGLLRLDIPYNEQFRGRDVNRHPAGVYNLAPESRNLSPLAFIEVAFDSNPARVPPVAGPSIEDAKGCAKTRNNESDALHPISNHMSPQK